MFSRASRQLHVITSSFDWFIGLSVSSVIGQSWNYFVFGSTALIENRYNSHSDFITGFSAKLQNTRPLMCISLNKNSNYCSGFPQKNQCFRQNDALISGKLQWPYKKSFSFYLKHQVSGFRCDFKPFRIPMFNNHLQSTKVGRERTKLVYVTAKDKVHHDSQLTSNDL